MSFLKILTLLAAIITSQAALAEEVCGHTCQSEKIEDYYIKISKVMMAGSSVEDVRRFLTVLHNDVRYIHVKYEADFDKEAWHKAFMRRMEGGNYNNHPEDTTKVLRIIHGYNSAAVEFISKYTNEDGVRITNPKRLAFFTFKDGKISKIQDYWYHLAEE